MIDRLVPTLAANAFRIVVEGHTDNLPIQTERFPSNWELSASRASSVVRYLQLAGIEATRLSATGYADTRPLADNADERGRQQPPRRAGDADRAGQTLRHQPSAVSRNIMTAKPTIRPSVAGV